MSHSLSWSICCCLTLGILATSWGAEEDADLPEIVSILLEATDDEDERVRLAAFSALTTQPKTEELQAAFRRGLKDPSHTIRRVALQQLYQWDAVTEEMSPMLIEFLAVPTTATLARKYLLEFGDKAVPDLLEAVKNVETKRHIAQMLGEIKLGKHRPAVAAALAGLAKDHDPNMRQTAIKSLGRLADPNRGIPPRYLQYYGAVIKKHDANGDGVLTADEWKTMPEDPSPADRDKDGRITPAELALWSSRKKE